MLYWKLKYQKIPQNGYSGMNVMGNSTLAQRHMCLKESSLISNVSICFNLKVTKKLLTQEISFFLKWHLSLQLATAEKISF